MSLDLTLILTEDCNLRCRYCYQKDFRKNDMPADLPVAAFEKAIEAGHDHIALTFFGGEPLLRADTLFDVLGRARRIADERGVMLTAKVPTNGLLLTDEIVERAEALGLFISLSFDGVRAAQDAGRVLPDGRSSYDEALAALDRLVSAGAPFGVYSVVTAANVAYLAESRRFLYERGARILVGAVDYTSAWDDGSVRELARQIELLGGMYGELLKTKQHFHLEPLDSRIAQRTRGREMSRRCCPGITQVTVGPDGTLYGCVEFFYRRLYPLGHVDRWIDPPASKELATDHLAGRPDECKSCGVNDRCLSSTCACVNLRTTGVANRPPLALCLTEQATLQAVDRVAGSLYRARSPQFVLRQYSTSFHLLSTIEGLLREMDISESVEAPVNAGA